MVLNGNNRFARNFKTAIGAIKQRFVAFFDPCRQGGRINREAMIHGDDLNFAGLQVLDRVVCPVVALLHFHGFRAQGERQELMTEANA